MLALSQVFCCSLQAHAKTFCKMLDRGRLTVMPMVSAPTRVATPGVTVTNSVAMGSVAVGCAGQVWDVAPTGAPAAVRTQNARIPCPSKQVKPRGASSMPIFINPLIIAFYPTVGIWTTTLVPVAHATCVTQCSSAFESATQSLGEPTPIESF
jgi:hypothetical protein